MLGVLGYAERGREIVARARRQDAQGHALRKTGPAETVDHVVDRAVPTSHDEKPGTPLLGGPDGIVRTLGLNPLDLEPLELVADLFGIIPASARSRIADDACLALLHTLPAWLKLPR